jgi:oligopeptide/dipeptide ABC transporter ATP-binding protein
VTATAGLPPAASDRSGGAAVGVPAAESNRPLLRVRDLQVRFKIAGGLSLRGGGGLVRAVDGIDLDIARGETLGLVGESGCGKTTAGRAIVRLLDPTAGSVNFDGVELATLKGEKLRHLRQRFQMIFQDPYSSLNPRMTVGSIVGEPLDIHNIGNRSDRPDRVVELLETVGLSRRSANRFPHEFSGGQRQRVGVARALALNPDLVVADEPISALDVSIRAQILNLLERLQAEFGLSYLLVAHDLAAVRHISDRVAVMYLGKIVETAPAAELYRSPLHPYTIALLSAVPIPDPAIQQHRRRIILKGDIPSPLNPPSGCRFHTRCWLYERLARPEECRTVLPPLNEASAGHRVACHFAAQLDGSIEQRQATGRPNPSVAASPAGGAGPSVGAGPSAARSAPSAPAPAAPIPPGSPRPN